MFIKEITTLPRTVDGRKFVEHTIFSKFKKGDVSITTIYMNDKPILKQYTIDRPDKVQNFWKSLTKKNNVQGFEVEKGLDITV